MYVRQWQLIEPLGPGDTEVHLRIMRGGCDAEQERVERIDVTESEGEIVIAAYVRKPAEPPTCPLFGEWHPAIVTLDAPRGERRLVDQFCTQNP